VYLSSNCTLCVGHAGIEVENEQEILETYAKTTPHCAYGRSKKVATELVVSANGCGRLHTLVLLPGMIIGPGEPKFMENVLSQDVMPYSSEYAGQLNFASTRSIERAVLAALGSLSKTDNIKAAGHIFLISDVLENFASFETAVRIALGRPHDKFINGLMPIVALLSQFVNWITNDRLNHMFLQGTSAAVELAKRAPALKSTQEAQNVLGWKPTPREDLIQELVNHYRPQKK